MQNAQQSGNANGIFGLAKGAEGCYNGKNGGDYMKDFPVFTTEYGVSSLILREVPYRQEAYIHIQDVQPDSLSEHLKDLGNINV